MDTIILNQTAERKQIAAMDHRLTALETWRARSRGFIAGSVAVVGLIVGLLYKLFSLMPR